MVLHEELIVAKLVENFPASYRIRNLIIEFTKPKNGFPGLVESSPHPPTKSL